MGSEIIWWVAAVFLMLTGLIGTIVPLIPGTVLILAGAVIHRLGLGEEHSVGWGTLLILTFWVVVAQALDLLSGSMGAKYFGATRWGAIGGILGAVIGLFFGLPGIFLGPLVGVLVGELLGGKGLLPAGRSTWGSLLGTTAGIIGKFVIGIIMIAWFFVALRLGW
jgi:uncharacterized protein YqgC (DUF456 family)